MSVEKSTNKKVAFSSSVDDEMMHGRLSNDNSSDHPTPALYYQVQSCSRSMQKIVLYYSFQCNMNITLNNLSCKLTPYTIVSNTELNKIKILRISDIQYF